MLEYIGKQFKHYASKKTYKITDLYRTYNQAGELVEEKLVTESECIGQFVKGEIPLSTVTRSVLRFGWQ